MKFTWKFWQINWKFWQKSPYVTADEERWTKRLRGSIGLATASLVGVYVLAVVIVGWWWSYEPDLFDPVAAAEERARNEGVEPVTGYTTAATVVALTEVLLDKRGGYLSNDILPPGLYLDNVPSWEFGVLTHLRDISRALRHDLSRSQSQSAEDPDLAEAEGHFFYDNSSWIFPATEHEPNKGATRIAEYASRLADPASEDTQFYARADNLARWLQGVETRLGDISQRLSQSVGKRQLHLGLAGDPTATMATDAARETETRTSWFEIDDVFYEARGQAWALYHLLRAVEHDFGPVLDDKNARVSLRQIIRELEATQATIWSPMILNGGGFGFLANHSLVIASYVSRVNAAIIDLRDLLDKG